MKIPLHIGIDDTDSTKGGCTTYIAALLVEKLGAEKFLDYPNLIRLNPNVPWKTRGNAALSLRISIDKERIDEVFEEVVNTVEEMSQLDCLKTEPGIVFLAGNIPQKITSFTRRTIKEVVSMKEALDLIRFYSAEAVGFKGGRGIIGALAAVGGTLFGDYTFELIAYRTVDNRGKKRRVDSTSVIEMDKEMMGLTFNNIDYETGRVLLTPRGPDPVLLGVRGESAYAVKKAYQMIDVYEDIERWVIFRTNQGTDAHLQRVERITQIKPYISAVTEGYVIIEPFNIPGRHIIFVIEDDSGEIDCAAYEPTGKFRNIAKKLIKGDHVEVYGGVIPRSKKHPKTINLEKIKIIKLIPKISYSNPNCGICNKHMESMGKEKGFRCKKCGFRVRDAEKVYFEIKRNIEEGLYITPPRANRHLTKPRSRYCLEKTGKFIIPGNFWGFD